MGLTRIIVEKKGWKAGQRTLIYVLNHAGYNIPKRATRASGSQSSVLALKYSVRVSFAIPPAIFPALDGDAEL